MPIDLVCRQCDYALTVGFYHYHTHPDGYWGRTAFACGNCGTTHYVERAIDKQRSDRYLYHHSRSKLWDRHPAALPTGKPEIGESFSGFEDFVCPVCESKGNVIADKDVESELPPCPLCAKRLEFLTTWLT